MGYLHRCHKRILPGAIIHFSLPSHGGPHFANFKIIWSIFHGYDLKPWTYVPCGMFTDNPGVASRFTDREMFFMVIVKFHKMPRMFHQMYHVGHFQRGKWIMNYGIFRLGLTHNLFIKNFPLEHLRGIETHRWSTTAS